MFTRIDATKRSPHVLLPKALLIHDGRYSWLQRLLQAQQLICEVLPRASFDVGEKYFLVVICGGSETVADAIRQIRHSASGNAVLIVISPDLECARRAYSAGANLGMVEPVKQIQIERPLRCLMPIIRQSWQQYVRVPVRLNATLSTDNGTHNLSIVNLSQGGCALANCPSLPQGTHLQMESELDGSRLAFKAQLIWRNDSGRAGARFIWGNRSEDTFARSIISLWLSTAAQRAWPIAPSHQGDLVLRENEQRIGDVA